MDDRFLTQIEQLAAVGRAQELKFDGVVARVTVDRFCSTAQPTQEEIDRFTAVMLEAMPGIDADAALRIANKLATNSAVPEIILAGLAERDVGAAAIIFRSAPRLSTTLMLRRAERGDWAEAAAIAMRPDLDRLVVAALARRTEAEPLRALAANETVRIDASALPGLVQRGRFDAALARALLRRPELGLRALPLFLAADSETRRRLIVEAQRAEQENGPVRSPSLLDASRQTALSAARAANRTGFATAIAMALRTGRANVEQMIDDEGGEPLALIFAATGASAASAADAMAMLHPRRFATLSSNAILALETGAAAAARIVVAAANGRAGKVHATQQYAPLPPASFDAGARLFPMPARATKLNRA